MDVSRHRLGMFTILVEPIVGTGAAVRSSSVRNFEVLLSNLGSIYA